MLDEYDRAAAKYRCTNDHLSFVRHFFKQRSGTSFIVNWHHRLMCDAIQEVIDGKTKNLVINVSPGSSKTEIVVINFIARGLALNPNARFLHLSYSDDLALLNSQTAREIVRSDEFQELWPRAIATDTKAKKRWNIMMDGKMAGGVYATSLSGQVTGFRAGHMTTGFQGAIIIDDPMKPEDAFSKAKLDAANRRLLTTVKSRRASPDTPIVVIMQRISQSDQTGFIESGGLQGSWKFVKIPALLDHGYLNKLDNRYREGIDTRAQDAQGRFSYWQYKEPLQELVAMEGGQGTDKDGNRISRQVFTSQYQQTPTAMGGNIFKGQDFKRYEKMPKIHYRKIFADTAQKTKEHNDYSVFELWGEGDLGIYLLDMIRGKWESPELEKRAVSFWMKHAAMDPDKFGVLREMKVEDKSSGTGLIQMIKAKHAIPIKEIPRDKDKYLRSQNALPYIEAGLVHIPETAPFSSDFITECEAFTAEGTHAHDDQIDPMMDAIDDMLSTKNSIKTWERLGG